MTKESQYARALYALTLGQPDKAKDYLHNLEKVLERRGHQKLLPRIFSQYRSLAERATRTRRYKEVTPQGERTRVLLEVYRKLTH